MLTGWRWLCLLLPNPSWVLRHCDSSIQSWALGVAAPLFLCQPRRFRGLVCGMSLPFWLCLKGTRKFSSFVTGDWTLQEWGSIWNCSRSSKKWVSIYILDCKTEHIHLWSQSKILQIIKLDIILFRFTLTSFTIVSLWWQIVSNEVYSWLGYALSHALKKKWINICIRKSGIICCVFVISLE